MVHNNFSLAICTHLGVQVEWYARKSQRFGEGVTVEAGRDGGLGEGERDYWNQDGRFFNVLGQQQQ